MLPGFYIPPLEEVIPVGGFEGWWDAADTSSFVLSGSNVTTWKDKSGKGRDATGVSNPTRTLTQNSKSVVSFNGSSQHLTIASAVEPRTIACVWRHTAADATVNRSLFGVRRSGASPAVAPVYFKSATDAAYRAGFVRSTALDSAGSTDLYAREASGLAAATWRRTMGTMDDSAATLALSYFRDGGLIASDTSVSTLRPLGTAMVIGASEYSGAVADFHIGDIAELLIWSRVLTAKEIAGVRCVSEG